jgi:hypothetical protein
MRIIVGGLARKTGKTALVCRIAGLTPHHRWLAVKVSHHPPDDGAPYQLTEEFEPGDSGDTRRYLEAGAARSFWFRGDLAAGLADLKALLATSENWIVESTRAVRLLEHDYALLVVAPDHLDDSKLLALLHGGEDHREGEHAVDHL